MCQKTKKSSHINGLECIAETVRINNHNEIILFKREDNNLNLLNMGLSGNNKTLSKIST